MNPKSAVHWLAHAEAEARKQQQALDDLDGMPSKLGDIDVAQQRRELIAAHDEYLEDVAHWRRQLASE